MNKGVQSPWKAKAEITKDSFETRKHKKGQLTQNIKPTSLIKGAGQCKRIAIEDFNVSGMLKNHELSRAISDLGFYELRRQLQYKARM